METINKLYGQETRISLVEYIDEEIDNGKVITNLDKMSPVAKSILTVAWAIAQFFLRIIEFAFTLITAPFAILADLFKNIFVEREIEILDGLTLLGFRIVFQLISTFTEPIETLKTLKSDDDEITNKTTALPSSSTGPESSSTQSSDIEDPPE